ncbi:MAG: hypothetical protein ACYC44_02595 [Patescibacteria group bacterium]
MRKIISFFSTAAMVIAPLCASLAAPVAAQATTTGLIKGPLDSVYWHSANNKRYVFPTEKTFQSWYGYSSPDIQVLTFDELGAIPIGGNATYKPGVRLVKITTDPKVYAVARYGTLRWITSEALARELYGSDWARKVDDIPDAFFTNYKIGANINSTSDFNPASEAAAVTTPEDNIGTPAATAPTSPTGANPPATNPTTPQATSPRFYTSVSKTTITPGETIRLSETLNSSITSPAITKMDILDPRTASPIQTCTNVSTCSVSITLDIRLGVTNIIFHARGYDSLNNLVAEEWFPTVSIVQPQASAPSAPTITSPYSNQIVTTYPRTLKIAWSPDNQKRHTVEVACDTCGVTGLWSSVTTYYADNYTMEIPSVTLPGDNQFRVRAKAINSDGVEGTWSGWVYFSAKTTAASAPAAPVLTAPLANQQFINYPRTLTASWVRDGYKTHTIEVACDYCVSVSQPYSNPTTYIADNYASSYAIPALPGDNQYRIRIKTANENNVDSPWSNYTYFSFKTPAATTDLQITDVLFRDATVNDNLGTLVGLRLNRQSYKVSLKFTSPTGLSILNGYTNLTHNYAMPYEDNYVMLMNNLASNVDYQYTVTAEDWNGAGSVTKTGTFHSPTLTQTFVYMDYQVSGTSQQGQVVISPTQCNQVKCGYNFMNKTYTAQSLGAFYSLSENGVLKFYANNVGQGGIAPLANGDTSPPLVSSGQYYRFGVPISVGSWYAVYDEANQMFIKLHVSKIVTP